MTISQDIESNEKELVFQLFVAGNEPNSQMAINNLRKFCELQIKGRYRIEILDVLQSFDIALENNIFLTPALKKILPAPTVTILGNLSNTVELFKTLQSGSDI